MMDEHKKYSPKGLDTVYVSAAQTSAVKEKVLNAEAHIKLAALVFDEVPVSNCGERSLGQHFQKLEIFEALSLLI